MPADTFLEPDTLLGRYRIVRTIGTGGMGAVYEATHLDLKKTVAIKALHRSALEHSEVAARFLREGEVASRIRHPHVVDVFDVGTHEGVPYLVMEYLEGETLSRLISRQSVLPVGQLADLMIPIFAAVAAAHDEGVVHRDLKPQNIFLARTRQGELVPKVLDFGIAKIVDDPSMDLTTSASILGTPHYLPPEQARGAKHVDARADQYALGVTMYEVLTGKRPFRGDSLLALVHAISNADVVPPRVLRPEIPEGLESAVLRAMSRDPDARFGSVLVFARAVLPYASERVRAIWTAPFEEGSTRSPRSAPASTRPPANEAYVVFASASSPLAETVGPPVARAATPPIVDPSIAVLSSSLLESIAVSSDALNPPFAPASPRPAPSRSTGWLTLALVPLLVAVAGLAAWKLRARPTLQETLPPLVVATPAARVQNYAVHVATTPPTAVLELDGRFAGTGSLESEFPLDGVEHSLRVSAPGFAPTVVTFRDAPPPARIVLATASAASPTIRTRHTHRPPR